jgi:hypothetical protein
LGKQTKKLNTLLPVSPKQTLRNMSSSKLPWDFAVPKVPTAVRVLLDTETYWPSKFSRCTLRLYDEGGREDHHCRAVFDFGLGSGVPDINIKESTWERVDFFLAQKLAAHCGGNIILKKMKREVVNNEDYILQLPIEAKNVNN